MPVDFEQLHRLFLAGNPSALHQAADACRDPQADTVAVPSWVLEELVARHADHLREQRGSGTGRHAPPFARHRMDFAHVVRHSEVVKRLRQRGLEKPSGAVCREVAKDLEAVPWLEKVAWGSVKRSYELVEELRKSDPEAFRARYHFGHPGAVVDKKLG